MTDEWETLAGWWRAEVRTDPMYDEQVLPLLLEALRPEPGARYLDLGCGEGQGARAVGPAANLVVGCDVSADLLATARHAGPVVRCRLPDLRCFAPESFDAAYAVLVLEHLDDTRGLFVSVRDVVRPRGALVVVANHPAFTAPGAGPFVDPQDGEVLWRWGPYLRLGISHEPAGSGTVTFRHRPLGELLSSAADAGWALEWLAERGIGATAAERDPLLAAQRHVPRLLAGRWRR